MREKWAPLLSAYSHVLPFPNRGNHRTRKSLLALNCAGLIEEWTGKTKLFLLPTPVHSDTYSFALLVCWKFPFRNQDFRKGSLIHGWLSKAVFPRGPQTIPKEATAGSHSHDHGLSAYYFRYKRRILFPSPLTYVARSHSSLKGAFVHGWMPNFCWVQKQKQGTSYAAMSLMLISR